jgi:replication factor C small subunit
MLSFDPNDFMWSTKYRPRTVDECVLSDEIKSLAKGYLSQGRLPNLLFSGSAGIGKTTLALAMCEEIKADFMIINASSESGIDTIRNQVTQFASTASFSDAKKVIILDEADFLSPNAQAALRNVTESCSKNASFIFTCNFKNRIIEAIHSRCANIEFKIPNQEKATLAVQMLKRIQAILDQENVTYEKKVLAELIQRYFPDFRRLMNELQRYSASGNIDTGILINMSEESFNELLKNLKDKKYNLVRQWVAQNSDVDSTKLFEDLYNKASEKIEAKSIPELVLILAKYQYQAAFVADSQINTMAALTEIMMQCQIK